MPQTPLELIRQVQIRTRSAAGLSDYNPADPTLPSLPPLSAAIAASDPSSPQLRCKNCKGTLLRGSETIICVFCGLAPHHDVIPDPISFTSTVGYQWLLRSLRLDGSEMVDATHKCERNQGYNSPKSLTPLSEFLNFKISWLAETEKQQIKNSEQNEGSLKLTGVAPDKFFLKSRKNILSDVSTEHASMNNQIGTSDDGKNVVAFGDQNLFQNVVLSEPADSSSKAFSGWEADFQSANSENQRESLDASVESKNNVMDPKSVDLSTGLGVNLAAHIDSVFGPKDPNGFGKLKENPVVSLPSDEWNSDDAWNNLSSYTSHLTGGVNPSVKFTNEHENDHSVDLFQDFQSLTNNEDKNEVASDEQKIMDEDVFGEWNDFTGSTKSLVPSQDAWTGGDDRVPKLDQKTSDMDFFSCDNASEKGDFGSFSQPDLFSSSTSKSNTLAEVNAVTSESPASDWLFDASGASHELGQATSDGNACGKSVNDDVKMLISQMHDLSFMLHSNLSIPSGQDAAPPNSS